MTSATTETWCGIYQVFETKRQRGKKPMTIYMIEVDGHKLPFPESLFSKPEDVFYARLVNNPDYCRF